MPSAARHGQTGTMRRLPPRTGRPRPRTIDPVTVAERQPQLPLRRAIGLFGGVVLPLGAAWFVGGLALADPALVVVAIVAMLFGTTLLVEYWRSERWPASRLATRAALATNLAIAAAVTAEPMIGVAMTMSALIPAVLALAYVDRRLVGRLMFLGAVTGTYAAIAPSILPWTTHLASPLDLVLPTSTLVVAYAIFHVFLWNASGQLTDTWGPRWPSRARSPRPSTRSSSGGSSPAISRPRPAPRTAPSAPGTERPIASSRTPTTRPSDWTPSMPRTTSASSRRPAGS
jgi:hypothetical protein